MFSKKFSHAMFSLISILGSVFISSSCVEDVFAKDEMNDGPTETSVAPKMSAKSITRTKTLWEKFKALVENGANESDMEGFFKEVFDDAAISKRFCGKENPKVIKAIVRFLLWRLESEAIQSVKGFSIDEKMTVTGKKKTIYLHCKLQKKNETPIEMTVVYSRKDESLGKAIEVIVVGIPLIEGVSVPIKRYLERKGKRLNDIRSADKRADVIVAAIDDFIKSNSSAKNTNNNVVSKKSAERKNHSAKKVSAS